MKCLNRCLLASLVCSAFVLSTTAHAAGLTAKDVLATLKPEVRKQLEAGKIVTIARPEQETSDAGLAVSMAVLVPADVNKTLSTLRSIKAKSDPKQRRTAREITGSVRGDGSSPAFATIGSLLTKSAR